MLRFLGTLLCLWGVKAAVVDQGNGVNMVVDDYETNRPPTKSFTVETGASVGRLAVLNDVPPAGACVVFMDAAVGCDGKIGFWQFYTQGAGYVCFGVFNRKKTKAGETLYESAGKNCINVTDNSIGFKEVEVPSLQKLSVNPSSVVAVHYLSNEVPENERVITVESNSKPAKYAGLQLGKVMVIPEVDMRPGQFFREDPYKTFINGVAVEYRGVPSVKAIVVGMSNVLDLRDGDNSRSGVAMIFMNNVWGTMCDRWYHEKGWPYLFCAEKDFPDTDQIFYTDTPERFQVSAKTPIHLKNPRCKFSGNVTMFSCATHDNVTCNHTNDVFIRCKSKVDMRKGATPSEGICYVYESNYWGSICDSRDLKLTGNHWAHVCCRERGFPKGAASIQYASEVIVNSNSQSVGLPDPISMHSPVCMGGSHNGDIKMCKDGPLEYRCDHSSDVYVKCDID